MKKIKWKGGKEKEQGAEDFLLLAPAVGGLAYKEGEGNASVVPNSELLCAK